MRAKFDVLPASILVAWYCCDRKSRAVCAQSFAPWQQATIEIMLTISLTIACSRYIYNGVILYVHPVRGESHNQRYTTGEVATSSPPFYNEPHLLHVLCVKAELGTTSTSWSQHHFVAIWNPESHNQSTHTIKSHNQSMNHTINATPPERLQQYQQAGVCNGWPL